jgi:hypothetical protein
MTVMTAASRTATTIDSRISTLIRHGAIAGIAGGLAIAATGMILDAALGIGFWALPNAIGGIVLGPGAGAGAGLGLATLIGVVVHMVLSVGFGAATLFAIRRITREHLATAVAMGLGLWLVNYYVVGRLSAGAHAVATLNPIWMAGALHALFGAVVGVVARKLDRSER